MHPSDPSNHHHQQQHHQQQQQQSHIISADVSLAALPHAVFLPFHAASSTPSRTAAGLTSPAASAGAAPNGLRADSMEEDEEEIETSSSSSPSVREIVTREASQIVELQRRFSVRDLASRFEKGQAAAQAAVEKLSSDVRLREAASLDQHALLRKLREVLEVLQGRVSGSNKDDAEEALTIVHALSSQLSEREAELTQEKLEVRKLAALFKQASDDAKRMVEEARTVAHTEIEAARASARRMEEALEEKEKFHGVLSQQELDEMRREVQEARRIKMLHESSKAMDMEHELEGLRRELTEKSIEVMKLRKQLEAVRLSDGERKILFQLDGTETLGSCLQVAVVDGFNVDLQQCHFQWHRISADRKKMELISGAVKSQYAPEPFDVGRYLRVDITLPNGDKCMASSSGVIDPAPGLGNYVEALVRKGGAEFQVIIVQQNGEVVVKQSVHGFNIGRVRIKLRKGRSTKAKEPYSASMQLCGMRGGGLAAAQTVYWQAKKGLTFLLAFESARERNAAVMLARRFSFDCNIMLAGPDDRAPLGT